jgi:hypothetical protein
MINSSLGARNVRAAVAAGRSWLGAVAITALLTSCASPGPLHVYSFPRDQLTAIRDSSETDIATAETPSFIGGSEQLEGFAYDPFTDHFFLRLRPGNRIRVVDRPARAVKREFVVNEVPSTGGGDIAVRPQNGHLYLIHPTEPKVIELTRLGAHVRTLPLGGATTPAKGLAYDSERNRLLALMSTNPARIDFLNHSGQVLTSITLERAVGSCLAYDAKARTIYAPLVGEGARLGVFDENGRLLRMAPAITEFVDVGPRSFVRMF